MGGSEQTLFLFLLIICDIMDYKLLQYYDLNALSHAIAAVIS